MKKKFKSFLIVLFALFAFALSGCTTSFCSPEDEQNIKSGLKATLDANGTLPDDYMPSAEHFNKAGVDSFLQKNGVTIPEADVYTWEYLGTLTQVYNETEGIKLGDEAKQVYVDYIFKTYHPKACLTIDEHTDVTSGGTIEGKTFGFAAKQGLLEILAWPVSWLYVKGAEIFGGKQFGGWAICLSIIVVTLIIRGIILLCTLKSSRQQQEMQSIQGEMNAINEKYAGRNDPDSRNRKAMETMALYKKHNINPAKSLIQPFITLPIFIAVYSAVKDTTVIFEKEIAGLSLGAKLGSSILHGKWIAIVIFILMAGCQYLTMKLPNWLAVKNAKIYDKEKAKGKTNMIMYIFLIFIVIIAWMLPLAMSIYWVASSLFSIFQAFLLSKPKKTNSLQKGRK